MSILNIEPENAITWNKLTKFLEEREGKAGSLYITGSVCIGYTFVEGWELKYDNHSIDIDKGTITIFENMIEEVLVGDEIQEDDYSEQSMRVEMSNDTYIDFNL